MGMVVTYDSAPADSVRSGMNSLLMTLDLVRRGLYDYRYRMESRICMDYALESPDEIPCGGCVQVETHFGTDEKGFEEYYVSAMQITVPRYCA